MRILVTGANGFLGAAIAERLAARADVELIRGRRRPNGLGQAPIDLADPAALKRTLATAAPDIVVHAAGRTAGAPACLDADNRVATTALTTAIAEAAPAAGLVLLGSAAQYGRAARREPWREDDRCAPESAYGASKLAAEAAAVEIASRTGLKVAPLRIFNVVAVRPDGAQVLASFLRRAAGGAAEIEMGRLGAVRDFVDLADVTSAVERVIERRAWGEPINVCSGVGRTSRSLLEAVAGELGVRIVEVDDGETTLDWSVGDATRCAARLGFTPSADLSRVVLRAAAWAREARRA
jgi:nucleoside-diphosphate-sugar epimerase